MKVIALFIEFDLAHFRTHITKAFRDTYLIPLPTSVAGMFGAMLGIDRNMVPREFDGYLFGAKLLEYGGKSKEYATLLQDKGTKVYGQRSYISTLVPYYLLNGPKYLIAMAGPEDSINKHYEQLKREIVFLPYGGGNDFLASRFKINGLYPLSESNIIESYAPIDLVDDIILEEEGEIHIAPVKYNSCKEFKDFVFVYRGKIILNSKCKSVNGIALYPLKDFCYLVR